MPLRRIVPAFCLMAMAVSVGAQEAPAGDHLPVPALDVDKPVLADPETTFPLPCNSLAPGLPALLTSDWQRRRDQVLIPIGPKETGLTLAKLAQRYQSVCSEPASLACVLASGFARAAERLEAAAGLSAGCDAAARAFRAGYETGVPGDETARAYDLACLGSFSARKGDSPTAARPDVLADAEREGGLLSAVGLLEFGGQIICNGLLRNDGRFLTARHCVKGGTAGYVVRSADGAVLGSDLKVAAAAPWTSIGVPADWAVFDLPAPAPQVANTTLVALSAPAEVSLVAAYPHADATQYQAGDPLPRRALRFPKPGMCQALVAYKGCLQLVCQTVRGFSGAPIFSVRRPDGSYEVVGFVSESEGKDSKCTGTEAVANSTLAVSAAVFPGQGDDE